VRHVRALNARGNKGRMHNSQNFISISVIWQWVREPYQSPENIEEILSTGI
jgi:hypothetical protein